MFIPCKPHKMVTLIRIFLGKESRSGFHQVLLEDLGADLEAQLRFGCAPFEEHDILCLEV